MARIRTIKPEFPQSESIGALSRDARLLFIQLWTVVDDDGRARAASRMLASLLYPYDDDARVLMEGWLAELEKSGMIRRYIVDGSVYLDIPHWAKHQKIDHKSQSRLPAYEDASEILASPREASRSLAPDLGPRTSTKDHSADAEPSAPADEDARARLFREGKAILATFGVPQKQQGSMIGKWLKDCRDDETGLLAAIQFARDKSVAEPVAWITAYLKQSSRKNGKLSPAERALQLARQAEAIERGQGWSFEGVRGHRPDGEVDFSVPELPG